MLFPLHLSFMNGCLVTFNEAGSNRSDFLLQLFFLECFMSIFLASHFFSLSFFNSHPSNHVSFSHILRAWDWVQFFPSAPSRASVVVHGRAFPDYVSNSFLQFVRKNYFKLVCQSWRRDSILRPSERMLSILPQDHGVLACFIVLWLNNIEAKPKESFKQICHSWLRLRMRLRISALSVFLSSYNLNLINHQSFYLGNKIG